MSNSINCCQIVQNLSFVISMVEQKDEDPKIIEANMMFSFMLVAGMRMNEQLCFNCLEFYQMLEDKWSRKGINIEGFKKEVEEFKEKTARMTETEMTAELIKSVMLGEIQRRKKVNEKKSRDTRLIECCDFMKCLQFMFKLNAEKWREENKNEGWDFMMFLHFTSSYFKMKNKLCEKCLAFQESTVGQIPVREETKKIFREAKERFGIEENVCCYCRKEIVTFKDPVVIQKDDVSIAYFHLGCYK